MEIYFGRLYIIIVYKTKLLLLFFLIFSAPKLETAASIVHVQFQKYNMMVILVIDHRIFFGDN